MKLKWKYDRSTVKFEVPDSNIMSVLEPKESSHVPNEFEAITEAIRSPVGTESLSKMAGNRSKIPYS